MIRLLRLTSLVAATVLVGAPLRVDAQLLKGIRKAATDAAKKKVEEKVDGKPAVPAGAPAPSPSGTATAAADTRSNDVEITAERLDMILASYQTVLPEIARTHRFFAEADSAERNRERFSACVEKATEAFSALPDEKKMEVMLPLSEKAEVTMKPWQRILDGGLSPRMQAAVNADRASVPAVLLADSTQGVQSMLGLVMIPGTAKCGRYPFMSEAAARAESARLKNVGPDGEPRRLFEAAPTEAVRAAMSKTQFGRIRERVAFWALQELGRLGPSETRPPFSPFTDSELAAMTAKKKELIPLGQAWADGVATWATWRQLAW